MLAPVVPAGLLLGLLAAGCSSGAADASRYCDVVKQLQAAADPLADQAIFGNPEQLETALGERVRTFSELAAAAPAEIRTDADTLRDGFIKVNNALSQAHFDSAAANSDPVVQSVLADTGFQDAQGRVETYDTNHCAG
jgi:hypothetical protein